MFFAGGVAPSRYQSVVADVHSIVRPSPEEIVRRAKYLIRQQQYVIH